MRTLNQPGWIVVLAACVLLPLAGCGGGDEPPAPTASSGGLRARDSGTDAAPAPAPTGGEGWGTLKGSFVYQGDVLQLPVLQTNNKDPNACNPDGIKNEALVVDEATKGIAHIAIFARRVSRVHEDFEATAGDEVVFDQKDCIFLSRMLPMRVSQTLLIKNSDPVAHNTSIAPPGDTSENPLLSPDANFTYQFSRQQSRPVQVSCNVHPWMKAYILPRTDPYAAATNAQGAFEIQNLPAGEEIEFQIWHESATGNNHVLVIDGLSDDRGRFTKTIPQDGELDLGEIQIPTSAFSVP